MYLLKDFAPMIASLARHLVFLDIPRNVNQTALLQQLQCHPPQARLHWLAHRAQETTLQSAAKRVAGLLLELTGRG